MSRRCGKVLLLAVVACALSSLPSAVDAHASLVTPTSRNLFYFTTAGSGPGQGIGEWYANAGNGLGPRPFLPVGFPGVCGDPYQEVAAGRTNIAGITGINWPVASYTAGQRVRFRVKMQVNHGGRLTFRICDRSSNLDQACFDSRTLLRVDNNKPHTYILTGSWERTNAGFPEFIDTVDYVLPAGFTCTRCVLQMEYFTYNSCVEPCERSECDFYADRLNKILPQSIWGPKSFCSSGGAEIFRNCADISITGGSGGTCPTTCATPNACQTGGGCNTATRTCNPITNRPDGTACTGGTCRSGVCQTTSGCPTTCPTPATVCQTGGGCNTATRTCNPITNVPNGTPCSGGSCQNGVCQPSSGVPDPCPGIAPGPSRAACFCSKNPAGRYQDVFYRCSGGFWCYSGGSQYVPCSTGLMYDTTNGGICNWAANVRCDGSVIGRARVNRRAGQPGPYALASNPTRMPAQTAEEGAAAAQRAAAAAAAGIVERQAAVDPASVGAASVDASVVPTAAEAVPAAAEAAVPTVDAASVAAEPAAASTAATDVAPAAAVVTEAGVTPATANAAEVAP